uniref:Uncharacterized protein n=1 Tax=Vitis vinifera TaxID=29760 RepID=A5C9L1_VITVI|nr:hypothetical protein VITISV_014494 [Vitis vinifera]
MARTRGAQSSSPSSRKRAAPQTPVQGYTSKPPRPPRVPPIVKGAPMSPPVRRYQTRASSQPPKKKAKVSEPALIDLSEPEEPSSEPQPPQPPPTDSQIPSGMAPEVIIRRLMLTQLPIEGNLDCRARPFHSELCFDAATFRLQPELKDSFYLLQRYHMEHLLTPRDFFYPRVAMDFYQSMTTHHVREPTLIHFTIDGRHGIMGARHIAEALRIPYEPARPEDYRVWTNPSPSDIVRILSRGASTHQYLMRKELPPSMFFIDALLRHNIFPLQHWVQRRGVLLEALFRISEGFFFGPHHLIMAALLYFEEKSPYLRLHPLLDRTTPQPPPVIPAISEPSSSFEPRTTISEYRALCHTLQALTTSQSILTQEMTALRAHQEQIIATQTQHTAILRQIQSHLGIPSAPQHQMPAPLEPTEPTPGDTQTST